MWYNSKLLLREFLTQLTFEGSSFKNAKSWPVGKDPDAIKDWGQEEKGVREDEIVGWHHWLNRHEFEQTPGDGERQGAWCAVVHGVAKSQTWLSDWTTSFKKKKKPNRT